MSTTTEARVAGRILDGEVAELIMGFHREGQPPDYDGQYIDEPVLLPPGATWKSIEASGYQLPPKGLIGLSFFCPRYSTNLDDALKVLGKLNHVYRYPEMQWGPTEPNGEKFWRVSLVNPADVDVFAETLPLAICLAGLRALA